MNTYVSVKYEMPKNGAMVIATYNNKQGNRRYIIAYFVEQYSYPSYIEDEQFEYCEKDDIYYLKKGWYEQLDNWDDYTSIYVFENKVDYWMEIPSLVDSVSCHQIKRKRP